MNIYFIFLQFSQTRVFVFKVGTDSLVPQHGVRQMACSNKGLLQPSSNGSHFLSLASHPFSIVSVMFCTFVRSFVRAFVQSFIRSFVRSFVHSFVPLFLRSLVCLFVCVVAIKSSRLAGLTRAN